VVVVVVVAIHICQQRLVLMAEGLVAVRQVTTVLVDFPEAVEHKMVLVVPMDMFMWSIEK